MLASLPVHRESKQVMRGGCPDEVTITMRSGNCGNRRLLAISFGSVETLGAGHDRTRTRVCRRRAHRGDYRHRAEARAIVEQRRPYRHGNLRGSACGAQPDLPRSEEHTSELQSLMRISYAVFCLTHKN